MACLLCIPGIHAQDFTVTGKVIDNTGLEVIGANISIKGSAGVGTITNIDGQYTLKVNNPAKDVLVISYIGMRTQEVAVKGQKQINVTLQEDSKILDEVVVIGYGTSKRSDLTGSVVSVKNEDLMQTPTSDVAQALAGRVAGVQVMQSEGEPGASVSIRVRGGISITQSNEPLYVIDGFPSEDGMNSLDPSEIETIDILKDASSTAIYGARGANGVVVITTKKGAKDASKMNVSFNSYIGIRKVSKKTRCIVIQGVCIARLRTQSRLIWRKWRTAFPECLRLFPGDRRELWKPGRCRLAGRSIRTSNNLPELPRKYFRRE